MKLVLIVSMATALKFKADSENKIPPRRKDNNGSPIVPGRPVHARAYATSLSATGERVPPRTVPNDPNMNVPDMPDINHHAFWSRQEQRPVGSADYGSDPVYYKGYAVGIFVPEGKETSRWNPVTESVDTVIHEYKSPSEETKRFYISLLQKCIDDEILKSKVPEYIEGADIGTFVEDGVNIPPSEETKR